MKFFSLLVLLAFAVSSNALVAVLTKERAGTLDAHLLAGRSSALVKRSRSKCAPFIGTFSKRSHVEPMSTDDRIKAAAFEKRMQLPVKSMGYFYTRSFPNMTPIVPELPGDPDDMSTSVIQVFADLAAKKEFSTGVGGLKGCTTLYIISRLGIYASHYWESISFSPDDEWRDWDPPDPTKQPKTDAELFQETVTDMMTIGGEYHPKLDGPKIEDQYVKAYLIHPTQTWKEDGPTDVGYPDLWASMRATVGTIIPTLADASRLTDIPYVATTDEEILFMGLGTRGKNICKYDPAHLLIKKVQSSATHLVGLWVEDRLQPYHDDKW